MPSTQIALPGFATPSQPTDRLFFAVFPDTGAAEAIDRLAYNLREEHRLKGRPHAIGRYHVTLHHLGDFVGLPQDIVTQALEAAATVAMPPFEVAFDRAASFAKPRNQPYVLRGSDRLAGLVSLQQRLGDALARAGLNADRKFTPHVTLMYDDSRVAEQLVEPIGWTVNEFVLVRSLLRQTRHERLGHWALHPVG
jgi:2'-5' RNA ligase